MWPYDPLSRHILSILCIILTDLPQRFSLIYVWKLLALRWNLKFNSKHVWLIHRCATTCGCFNVITYYNHVIIVCHLSRQKFSSDNFLLLSASFPSWLNIFNFHCRLFGEISGLRLLENVNSNYVTKQTIKRIFRVFLNKLKLLVAALLIIIKNEIELNLKRNRCAAVAAWANMKYKV